jgi:hypothetical protein
VPVVGTQPEAGLKQPLRDRPAHVGCIRPRYQ